MTPVQPPKRLSTMRTASAAAVLAAIVLLAAPALWNGYPLLQYDTGGYLARWYEGYLVPSRSTVFGLYLHLGEGWHFWPIVFIQCALTVWIVALALRVFGIGGGVRARLAFVVALALVTTLPWITSILLTDIFAGLSVIAMHLLVMHRRDLRRGETLGLVALIAFAAAGHSATFAVLLALLAAGALALPLLRGRIDVRGLIASGAAVLLGALMLLAANTALSGRIAWTPGGYGIVFGRMLQDGIVARYLDDNCATKHLRLCPYRHDLPATADEFLWSDGPFNKLGRFEGLGEEMRTIVLGSLAAYPMAQVTTALRATAEQIVLVGTGYGVNDQLWHTYGIIERYIRGEVPAMRAAHQQHGAFDFTYVNALHVPVAWLSMIGLLVLLARPLWDKLDDLALLSGSVVVAILANAFVCGALSGPHDRYGARIVWIATLTVMMAGIRLWAGMREQPTVGHRTVIAAP